MVEPGARTLSPDPLSVHVGCFEGPLDLLLFLVRRQEVDIWEVSLSEICDGYLEILRRSRDMDIEVSGEFLVIAATLLQIKSARLIPSPASEEEDAGPDPRGELIRMVLDYRETRRAAEFLASREAENLRLFPRGAKEKFAATLEETERLNPYVLFAAWQAVLEQIYARAPCVITIRDREPAYYKDRIRSALSGREVLPFHALFSPGATRVEIVSAFMALLELVRDGEVEIHQSSAFGLIRITAARKMR